MQRCSSVSPEMESISLDLPQAIKKGCALQVGCGGIRKLWWQAKKLFGFCDLRLAQAVRNLSFGDQ